MIATCKVHADEKRKRGSKGDQWFEGTVESCVAPPDFSRPVDLSRIVLITFPLTALFRRREEPAGVSSLAGGVGRKACRDSYAIETGAACWSRMYTKSGLLASFVFLQLVTWSGGSGGRI